MNEELINKILEGIAKDEGTEGRAVALEGGGSTRGYGITTIAEGLKKALSFSNLNADEMSDKDLARQIVIYNIGEMKKDMGEETWNNLPDQMKIVASDQYYNSGKLFDGFKDKNKTWVECSQKCHKDVVTKNYAVGYYTN